MRPLSCAKVGLAGWFSSPSIGEYLMISICGAEGWAAFGSIGMQCFVPASCQTSDKSLPAPGCSVKEKTLSILSSPPLCSWMHWAISLEVEGETLGSKSFLRQTRAEGTSSSKTESQEIRASAPGSWHFFRSAANVMGMGR